MLGEDMEPGTGYGISTGGEPAGLSSAITNVGDANGDGLADLVVGAPSTKVNGQAGAGAAYLLFTKSTSTPQAVGPALTPDLGVAVVGTGAGNGLGTTAVSLGDLDGDGLPDFAIGAPGVNGGAGSVYTVLGKSLLSDGDTGKATGVSDTSASLSGAASSNGRAAKVSFEYGPTAAYGSRTPDQDVAGNSRSVSIDADVSGLSASTGYHYRVVVRNALGLTRYGADKTFTTAQTPDAKSPDTKQAPDPCTANPRAAGCSGFVYCEANPKASECVKAGALSALIVSPRSASVKRGKKVKVTVSVTNTGNAAAAGVKVCLKAPSALVKGAKCASVGSLAAGKTVSKSFSVTVQKKAKRGKKASLAFTASGTGLKATTAKASVKVK